MKINVLKSLIFLVFLTLKTNMVFTFEDQKNEMGVYFGTKLYEERHPVDNSCFMSQAGWMLGLIGNNETITKILSFGSISQIFDSIEHYIDTLQKAEDFAT